MMIDPQYVIFGLGSVATMGVTWGVATTNAKAVKAHATKLENELVEHKKEDKDQQLAVVDRLARIETKLNMALGIKDEHS